MNKPCNECPFLKKSIPGYIGGHADVQEIIDIARQDLKFPCHLDVNKLQKEGESFGSAVQKSENCAGSLIFMNHIVKLSRDRPTADEQRRLGKSDEVFKTDAEMKTHHQRKMPL